MVGTALVTLPLHLDLPAGTPVAVPLVLLGLMAVGWVVSATGGACVDATGLRWRLYRPRAVTWSEIARVDLGPAPKSTIGPGVSRLAIRVARRGGRDLMIGPPLLAKDEGRRFGLAVADLARRRGIPVTVTDPGWGVDGRG